MWFTSFLVTPVDSRPLTKKEPETYNLKGYASIRAFLRDRPVSRFT